MGLDGRLVINTLNAFLEFNKLVKLDKIENSKSAVKKNPGYIEGRPPKFKVGHIEAALKEL